MELVAAVEILTVTWSVISQSRNIRAFLYKYLQYKDFISACKGEM